MSLKHWTASDAARKLERLPFDVACVQCGLDTPIHINRFHLLCFVSRVLCGLGVWLRRWQAHFCFCFSLQGFSCRFSFARFHTQQTPNKSSCQKTCTRKCEHLCDWEEKFFPPTCSHVVCWTNALFLSSVVFNSPSCPAFLVIKKLRKLENFLFFWRYFLLNATSVAPRMAEVWKSEASNSKSAPQMSGVVSLSFHI